MNKISKTFCILLLLGLLGITNAEAVWRVGGSLGLGRYNATDSRHLHDSKYGYLIGLGTSLTFPFGLYTRYDATAFFSGVMKGEITILSFGWRHEIADLYHIAWALGGGTGRSKDKEFKHDNDFDVQGAAQTFISVGYRLSPSIDVSLGFQRVFTVAEFFDERSISATVVSANIIYNFE